MTIFISQHPQLMRPQPRYASAHMSVEEAVQASIAEHHIVDLTQLPDDDE
jgi:hypothetical protein